MRELTQTCRCWSFSMAGTETEMANWYWTGLFFFFLKANQLQSSLLFSLSLSCASPHLLPLRCCFQNYDLITSSHLKFSEFIHWLKCLLDAPARWSVATLNSDCNSVTRYWLLRPSVYVQWDRIWKLVVSYWLSDLCCWEAHRMVKWVAARQFGNSVNTLWLFLRIV